VSYVLPILTETESIKWRPHAPGVERGSLGGKWFGQIHKRGRHWHGEIRKTDTGELVRPAGIWDTRRGARDEIDYHLRSVEAR
jgi:hypothetical protein